VGPAGSRRGIGNPAFESPQYVLQRLNLFDNRQAIPMFQKFTEISRGRDRITAIQTFLGLIQPAAKRRNCLWF